MRFVLLASLIATSLVTTSLAAQAASFRYRVFVPKSADCAAAVSQLKINFEQQTGVKVQSTQCAAVTIPGAEDQDTFDANAATLVYAAAHEVRVNSVKFGHGSSYGTGGVGLAGDIGGAYDSQADCQADLKTQTDLFKAQTGADAFAAYCIPPSMGGVRFGLQIDSLKPLAKQLYVFEAFDDETSVDSWTHVQQLVAAEGVTVARAANNSVYFYDTSSYDRPSHMRVRSVSGGLFSEGAECTTQAPVVAKILTDAGYKSFEVACTGLVGTSSMVIVGADESRLSINTFTRGEYASLAECKADESRSVDEARRKAGRGFIGGYCTFIDPMDALHAYGLATIFGR